MRVEQAYVRPTLKSMGVVRSNWTSVASELKQIRGLGFVPSLIILWCVDTTPANKNWSIGYAVNNDPAIDQYCMRSLSGGASVNFTLIVGSIYRDAGNIMAVTLDDFMSDGYDIDFVMTGNAPTKCTALAFA